MAEISPIDLQKALSGVDYPADREALVERAKKNKADESLTNTLAHLPQKRFEGPNEVSKAVFGSSR